MEMTIEHMHTMVGSATRSTQDNTVFYGATVLFLGVLLLQGGMHMTIRKEKIHVS